ncbi:MAG: hypothetical protein HC783_09295 [Rhodobacteraceae bacterium]|nr:hypothetical protein [Paracoccaceae bacterium]
MNDRTMRRKPCAHRGQIFLFNGINGLYGDIHGLLTFWGKAGLGGIHGKRWMAEAFHPALTRLRASGLGLTDCSATRIKGACLPNRRSQYQDKIPSSYIVIPL